MTDQSNRTFVCSVLFLDIVEYSKRSVAEQMALKQRFNALLGEVLQGVAANDRIVLDTGDGAAISFLGNPEDTLFAAISLRDATLTESQSGSPVLAIRMGVNLGPVRLIKDLNGHLNIIGDGINVAQRVMSFAQPGQVLVSRSYYEVVSRLSSEYTQLFRYEGSRTDKHVREHEVYEVGPTSPGLKLSASAASDANTAAAAKVSAASRRSDVRLLVLLPLGVAAVLAAGVAIRMQRTASEPAPAAQVATRPAAPAPAENQAPAPAAPTPATVQDTPAANKDPVPETTVVSPAPKAPPAPKAKPKKDAADRPAAVAVKPSRAPVAVEHPADAVAPPAPATLKLTIVPWGEVFVDGKSHGVSPPLRQVAVNPGKHLIVVQNTSLPPYTEQVDLKPGEQFTIRHRFN